MLQDDLLAGTLRWYSKRVTEKDSILAVFGNELPCGWASRGYSHVVALDALKGEVEAQGAAWVSLDSLVEPGSIYEASALLEDLSRLSFPDGARIASSFTYKGYELWWIHYESLYFYFCLPYTQYRKLLEFLASRESVTLYQPPVPALFRAYLEAYQRPVSILSTGTAPLPSLGVWLQGLLTICSLPFMAVARHPLLIYVGDKLEPGKDHDNRLRFLYAALREKKLSFVEWVRSLEPGKSVWRHFWGRSRPAVYPEAVRSLGRFCSLLAGGRVRARRQFGAERYAAVSDPFVRFTYAIATPYLLTAHEDVWAIRCMRALLALAGTRAAFIAAATDRNFHTVIACKLNKIPIVGILHGVASRHYNGYDFMPGFNGEKRLSVDRYGVWSAWWKAYYKSHSRAYAPEQLFISGPIRPIVSSARAAEHPSAEAAPRVLFIAEQTVSPAESMPYLRALLARDDLNVTVKFRAYGDGFEKWLAEHAPDLLMRARSVRGGMQEAISGVDVVVGAHSTGVLEALLLCKPPVFFRTKKWGDYYGLADDVRTRGFFAENPEELIEKIHAARSASAEALKELQERYFGDPQKNGSAWVVDQLQSVIAQ